jgi:NAD(P)-dependent dehydrogenase (short-subunit alcohol dehydrogenase family)
MDMGLAGKTVLITGAAGGIGQAAAEGMAAEGARVIGVDRDEAGLKAIRSLPAAGGPAHCAIAADLSTRDGTQAAMREALALAGVVDVLVSCAGVLRSFSPLEDLTEPAWAHTMAVNFHAFRWALAVLLPGMRAQGGGSVVAVSSDLATQPEGPPDYGVSKVGLLWLVKYLSVAEGPHGIRVNAVAPGPVDTGMWARVRESLADASGLPPDEAGQRELSGRQLPLGRILLPGEVANAITYLASACASGVTGEVMDLGGTSRHLT